MSARDVRALKVLVVILAVLAVAYAVNATTYDAIRAHDQAIERLDTP